MIEIQILSLLFLLTWLWNVKPTAVEKKFCEVLPWRSENAFYRLMFQLAFHFLNFTSPSRAWEQVEKSWKDISSLRYQLVLLGLFQLSFFGFALFILLLLQVNPLVLFLPFLVLTLLSRKLMKASPLSDFWIYLVLALFFTEPILRLLSMQFSLAGDAGPTYGWGFWLSMWLTSTQISTLLFGFLTSFFVSLFFQKFLKWSSLVSFFVCLMFASYQMSAMMAIFLLLGERFSFQVYVFQFLKREQWPLRKSYFLVQLGGLFFLVMAFFLLQPVSSSLREERSLQLLFFYLVIQIIFFVVTMTYGHFQALTDRRRAKN